MLGRSNNREGQGPEKLHLLLPFLRSVVFRPNSKVANLGTYTTPRLIALTSKWMIATTSYTPESVECPHNRLGAHKIGKRLDRGIETMEAVNVN
jgi:hypothetical protein